MGLPQVVALRVEKPSIDQMNAYQGAYDYFNGTLFGGSLPPVILNFSEHKNARGFYHSETWTNGKGTLAEISLCRGSLDRPMLDIMGTLVHEMCHHWQYSHGKTSRPGYHNQEWGKMMRIVGLDPDNGKGGATGQKVTHNIIADGLFFQSFHDMPDEHILPWKCVLALVVVKPKKEPTRVKYVCLGCSTAVWGKPDLEIVCKECDLPFTYS